MKLACLKTEIFGVNTSGRFEELCMEVFAYQAENNPVYKEYLNLLGVNPAAINSLTQIPALPIRFFKIRRIVSGTGEAEVVFTSSATTGMTPSSHYVLDKRLYEQSFIEGFRRFYGAPQEYTILALLPSYLERKGSSLVYMAEKLIELSNHVESGFYLYNYQELYHLLLKLKEQGRKTVLLGVSFALLDFVKEYKIQFPQLKVIETGGMKGRGKELSREELHQTLANGFGVEHIHSEYGMAELLSQAYSLELGIFSPQPWMKVLIRDLYDPFSHHAALSGPSAVGGINIIDLANLHSCSFIETEDRGKVFPDGSFTVDGRIREAELRGCNLLLE